MTSDKQHSLCQSRILKSVAAAALFLCCLQGCTPKTPASDFTLFTGAIMGTTYNVKVVAPMDEAATQAAAEAIEQTLHRVDGKMSTYKEDSELSRLNRHIANAPFKLSEETLNVIALAQRIAEESGGAFDITVGPLVNAWGFGPDALDNPPAPEILETLRALTGPGKIALDQDALTVTKADPAVYCDLSAIAKGYAVDEVSKSLTGLGYADFMVEVGGEVRAAGQNATEAPWRIAIEKPVEGGRVVQEIVGLSDVALATSGNYRNFYVADGQRISHTIDPRTGRPAGHSLASVSVIHPECALADAYATALMVLGPEEGMAFAQEHGLAVLFIIHDGEERFVTRQTPSFAPYLAAQ